LVIAATDDTQMNEAVYQEAVRERALCNVVDVPERCQFVAASIFRRGPLVAAISTGGASPALASRLRRDLMRHWGPEYGQVTLAFGRLRPYVRAHIRDIEDRKQFWKDIVQRSEPFEMARSGASRQALDTFLQGEVARWVAAQDTQRVSG
jgi:precorrin-2 dehydrogenase/sirohydrochlorin ferrochelatase